MSRQSYPLEQSANTDGRNEEAKERFDESGYCYKKGKSPSKLFGSSDKTQPPTPKKTTELIFAKIQKQIKDKL